MLSIIALVGLVDDLMSLLSAMQKLLGQAIAAGIAVCWLMQGQQAAGGSPILFAASSFAWILLLANATNLINGLDGLLVGTIAGVI